MPLADDFSIGEMLRTQLGSAACAAGLFLVSLLLAGCGGSSSQPLSTDEHQISQALCDGSDDIRLYFGVPPQGNMAEFDNIYIENGFRYFVVDGSCRYWAYDSSEAGGPYDRWNNLRTGILSEAQALQLSAEIRWADLSDYNGVFSNPDVIGGSNYRLTDGQTASISCEIRCPDRKRQTLFDAAARWQTWMLANGEAVDGNLRGILVLEPEDIHGDYDVAIELPEALQPLIVEAPELFGSAGCLGLTTLFEDDVQGLLQDLRDRYQRGDFGYFNGFIPMVDELGRSVQLHLRQSLPYETEDGLLSFGMAGAAIQHPSDVCPASVD